MGLDPSDISRHGGELGPRCAVEEVMVTNPKRRDLGGGEFDRRTILRVLSPPRASRTFKTVRWKPLKMAHFIIF